MSDENAQAEKPKKATYEIQDGHLNINVDTNQDGEASIEGKLKLSEVIGEAIAKGEAIEGAKVTEFRFEGTKLVLALDTDRDGEKVLELTLNLGEAFDEIQSAVKKD